MNYRLNTSIKSTILGVKHVLMTNIMIQLYCESIVKPRTLNHPLSLFLSDCTLFRFIMLFNL